MANEKSGDVIVRFVEKYRKALLALLIVITAGTAGLVIFFSVSSAMQKKAIAALEGFETRRGEMTVKEASAAEIDTFLEEIDRFASSTFGYAAARAWSLKADIYAERGEWKNAEETWLLSARKAPRIYLAPLSFYNAAVAAEEQGKLDEAVDYYRQSLDYEGIFSGASRAWFNIGRIYEAKNDKPSAAEAYRTLVEKAPPESNWAKLARSRIIFLDTD